MACMVALIPTERFHKSNWVEYHRIHCFMIKDSKPNTLLLGDSIVAGQNDRNDRQYLDVTTPLLILIHLQFLLEHSLPCFVISMLSNPEPRSTGTLHRRLGIPELSVIT